jgi:hypothetical protein
MQENYFYGNTLPTDSLLRKQYEEKVEWFLDKEKQFKKECEEKGIHIITKIDNEADIDEVEVLLVVETKNSKNEEVNFIATVGEIDIQGRIMNEDYFFEDYNPIDLDTENPYEEIE